MKAAFLEVANRIAHRLASRALTHNRRSSWQVVALVWPPAEGEKGFRIERAGPSLYDGLAGIALFFLEAHRATGERKYIRLAEQSILHACELLHATGETRAGFFHGSTGVAYVLTRIGVHTGEEQFVDLARKLLRECVWSATESSVDLVGGRAGVLAGILAVHRLDPDQQLLDQATEIGADLVLRARRGAFGWSWGNHVIRARDLTGVSHGASGIAHVLLELYCDTRDDRFRYAAQQGFAYEREFFHTPPGNWLDLRHDEDLKTETAEQGARSSAYVPRFMTAWCHGAPGMCMARVRAHKILGQTCFRDEVQDALAATKRATQAFPSDHDFSLCHGTAGRCEALLYATQHLPGFDATDFVRHIVEDAAERFDRPDAAWPCRSTGGITDPSLMVGESGIGHLFLQLAGSHPTPVLLIDSKEENSRVNGDGMGWSPVAARLRSEYVTGYFGRILSVMARVFSCDQASSISGKRAEVTNEIETVFRAINGAIETEPRLSVREQLRDAFAPERARFELAKNIPNQCDEVRADSARQPIDNWNDCWAALASHVRLVRTNVDWEVPPNSLHASLGNHDGVTYLVFGREGLTHLHRLTPFAATVLRSFQGGCSVTTALCRIAEMVPPEVSNCQHLVEEQLAAAYRFGLLEVHPVDKSISRNTDHESMNSDAVRDVPDLPSISLR